VEDQKKNRVNEEAQSEKEKKKICSEQESSEDTEQALEETERLDETVSFSSESDIEKKGKEQVKQGVSQDTILLFEQWSTDEKE
jgi:hypothetical protein